MLTEEDLKYLANKHRGGESNAKGNLYEQFYAVFEIAQLLHNHETNSTVKVSSQIEDAFIDDLLIVISTGKFHFYQLKAVESLTWQTGSNHTLESDFAKQIKLLQTTKTPFALHLIYSNPDSNVATIPEQIAQYTRVCNFPYFTDLNRLLLESQDFRSAISKISTNRSAKNDELLSLATILLGAWVASSKKDILIADLIQFIKKLSFSGNEFIFMSPLEINNSARLIYDRIDGFEYELEGATFVWSFRKMKGRIFKRDYSNFECQVIEQNPHSFDELETLM